jgi:hypothetical protein
MPDSYLERTIKLLIKTGILPIKKTKKRKSKKRKYHKHYANENNIKSNSIPISYGQPNISSLNATNQLAFTDSRNREIEYQNYLNPHLQRINDKINDTNNKIFDTNNKFENGLKDVGRMGYLIADQLADEFDNKLYNNSSIIHNNLNDLDNFYYAKLNDIENNLPDFKLRRSDAHKFIDMNKDNIDATTTQGSDSFYPQGINNDPNDLSIPNTTSSPTQNKKLSSIKNPSSMNIDASNDIFNDNNPTFKKAFKPSNINSPSKIPRLISKKNLKNVFDEEKIETKPSIKPPLTPKKTAVSINNNKPTIARKPVIIDESKNEIIVNDDIETKPMPKLNKSGNRRGMWERPKKIEIEKPNQSNSFTDRNETKLIEKLEKEKKENKK